MRRIGVVLLFGALFSSSGCGDDSSTRRVDGQTDRFAGADVSTFAILDSDGAVQQVGMTLPAVAIEGAKSITAVTALYLDFPKAVRETTFFDHFGLDWQPKGHEPQVFGSPHFDFHFYGIGQTEREAIDCKSEPKPSPEALPKGYVVLDTTTEPDGTCVPKMGVHATTLQDLVPNFTEVFILGYHAGKLAFVEPMVDQAYLALKRPFEREVPRPDKLGRSTRWPASFELRYDADDEAFSLTFSDFSAIE